MEWMLTRHAVPQQIVVKHGAKSWQRTLQVNAGSTITLNATLQ
jgi:hypothetical protein